VCALHVFHAESFGRLRALERRFAIHDDFMCEAAARQLQIPNGGREAALRGSGSAKCA
jgi:hypothetical protein